MTTRFIYVFILVKDGRRCKDILYSFLSAHPSSCTYTDCFFNGCTFLHFFLLTHLPESGMTTNDKPVVYTTVYFLRKINLPHKFNTPMNLLKVLLMRLNSNENYLGMWSLQQNIPISTTLNLILSSNSAWYFVRKFKILIKYWHSDHSCMFVLPCN